jgi:NitT/TauT family transport system substrate-binding protein
MLACKRWVLALAVTALCVAGVSPAQAEEKTKFRVAWSIYVGWMPWGHLADSGIMKKWADKHGIEVEIVQINDYVESINQFTAGAFDGCSMTNMDALSIPAAGGVDSTALIIGDFSNGNDGIAAKGDLTLAGLKGKEVHLVELSVSHYLLARALTSVNLAEKDLTVVNTSDADIVSAFTSSDDVQTVVTWNPQLSEVLKQPNTKRLYDSSQIPGEIIDLMVVNTETLKANPKFGKALTGAWYELMATMAKEDEAGNAVRSAMAKASGTDLAGFNSQLSTTKMFFTPAEAVAFSRSADLPKTMEYVRTFLFAHGLLGEGAKSADAVGIAFPGGKVMGDAKNLKFRFDPTYMEMAAAGSL